MFKDTGVTIHESSGLVIKYGHNGEMTVSVGEAKAHLPQLIRAVEQGETVVITRHGKAVAQLAALSDSGGKVVLGSMAGRIKLPEGWDAPIGLDEILGSDI